MDKPKTNAELAKDYIRALQAQGKSAAIALANISTLKIIAMHRMFLEDRDQPVVAHTLVEYPDGSQLWIHSYLTWEQAWNEELIYSRYLGKELN
jgi:hypothetical protein